MSSPRQSEGQRPRARSTLSFTSNRSGKSHRSGGSIGKIDLTETSKDKAHLNTKADPTLAISEAQPSVIALEASNLGSLREVRHKDIHGNPIVEPDVSNPTRYRFERPLDTIRSFEAAIESSYKSRRASGYHGGPNERPDSRSTAMNDDYSRRSSYFQGYPNSPQGPHGRGYQGGGYYGNRNSPGRPDSFIDQYASPNQQYPSQGRGPRPNPRNNSDPMLYGGNRSPDVYPSHGYHQSYDTMTLGGTNGTEPWGNSTDPSSENSSVDRIHQFPKQNDQQPIEGYGLNGNQQYREFGQGQAPGQGQGYSRNPYTAGPSGLNRFESVPESRPIPPPKAAAGPRVPIKLNSTAPSPLTKEMSKESAGKRKSWFKRRFSKD